MFSNNPEKKVWEKTENAGHHYFLTNFPCLSDRNQTFSQMC